MDPTSPLGAARNYLIRGWRPIPVPHRKKGPQIPGWQHLEVSEDHLEQLFDGQPSNVGVLLGKPSGGLVDVDLDALEAVRLADAFLPATGAVFGRVGKQRSHRLYCCTGLVNTTAWKDSDGAVLVEVRGEGCQTIFPPSTHPSGEAVEWADFSDPLTIDASELFKAVKKLAAAALLARHWPAQGSRHDAALALAGALAHSGWEQDDGVEFVEQVAVAAGDEEARTDRRQAAVGTFETFTEGKPVTGLPSLIELVGRKVVDRVAEWLGLHDQTVTSSVGLIGRDYFHAETLSEFFRQSFRYAAHSGKWMKWSGQVWELTFEPVVAKAAADVLRPEYIRRMADATDRVDQERWARLAQEVNSFSRISTILDFVKGWPGITVKPDGWDRDPWLLNVKNGTLDLRTCELRPHNPDDLITKLAPVEFQPEAQGRRWIEHLEMFQPDLSIRRQIQRDLGMALVGATLDEFLPIWFGGGGNGKTVTFSAILRILGDYADTAPHDLLIQTRSDRHPTELADLAGKRLVFSAETEQDRKLAESRVKSLTGGDRIKARYMRQDFFVFESTATIVLVTNYRPTVTGSDHGIWRRLRLIPWVRQVPPEQRRPMPEVIEGLVEEGPAILNWLLDGLKDWQSDKWWVAPEVQAATQAYREDMDTFGEFLEACCTVRPGLRIRKDLLRKAYDQWASEIGERAVSARIFTQLIREHGIGDTKSDGQRVFVGVDLNPAWKERITTAGISPWVGNH